MSATDAEQSERPPLANPETADAIREARQQLREEKESPQLTDADRERIIDERSTEDWLADESEKVDDEEPAVGVTFRGRDFEFVRSSLGTTIRSVRIAKKQQRRDDDTPPDPEDLEIMLDALGDMCTDPVMDSDAWGRFRPRELGELFGEVMEGLEEIAEEERERAGN